MGHLNLPSSKQRPRPRFRLLDLTTVFFFALILIFLLLVFTPLGDSFAATGRTALLRTSDPQQRHKLIALAEKGEVGVIETCAAEAVDHMPCEDPRRNSVLSREMNFYRERQCPKVEEVEVCLIPNPVGYKVPVKWPESLNKDVATGCT